MITFNLLSINRENAFIINVELVDCKWMVEIFILFLFYA